MKIWRTTLGIVLNPPPEPAAIVVTLDTGGYVDDYYAAAERYKMSGRRIEVNGECRSACTVLLEVPTLCVWPGAVFRWHQAYNPKTKVTYPNVTQDMLSRLPYRIANRLQGRVQKFYTREASLGYSELIALGVPSCRGSER